MNMFPKWPTPSDFLAAASRPDGVGLFEYRTMHQCVRRKDRGYRLCLHRLRVNTLLFCAFGYPPTLIVYFVPVWIGVPVALLWIFIYVAVLTPLYLRLCIRAGNIMKR